MSWLLAHLLLAGCVPHLTSPPGSHDTALWELPENTWPAEHPPSDLSAEGFGRGQVIPDFRMMDQHGDEVALWQFYGLVVAVDISAIWCGPCQELAAGVQETWEHFQDDGFMYVTVLIEDAHRQEVDLDDLEMWSDYYDISAPVLADGEGWGERVVENVNSGLPRILIVGRDMRIVEPEVVPVTDAAVQAAVERAL